MRRQTWEFNRLAIVTALLVTGFVAAQGSSGKEILAQDQPSASPSSPAVRCRGVGQPTPAPQSTYAVYASDGTRTSRSLKLVESFSDPKQAASKSLALRASCSSPCVVEWKAGQKPAEVFHPSQINPAIESCSVYVMTCSRSGWRATKANLARKEAEAWAEANRPEYRRVEVVYHVAAQ